MQIQIDRNKLFSLLGAFEEDLRSIIEVNLLATHHEHQVLGAAYERAIDRFMRDSDRDLTQTEATDYLDLGDELEILNRWQNDLPEQTRQSFARVAGRLGDLIPIRNRVMHRRPLLPDDFDTVQRILTQLDEAGFGGLALRDCLERFRAEPDWVPSGPSSLHSGTTLNNLPLADYDETGLVGRRRELDKLTNRLLRPSAARSPVLTVIGPGGVGKTALALQALHDLVNDPSCPYDLVSWVSLKTEQLTARGVRAIQDAVLSVEQAMPAMIEALDPSFEGSAAQLADSLDGLDALIVIDNLETVTGSEVLELIDALPDTVTYLLTSREGLGELERRFPLEPLKDRYAVDLLRRLSRARSLRDFETIDQETGLDLVRRLGASPLGLKWFVSSVAIGRDPEDLVRHSEDLVRYCVQDVFEALDPDSRAVASVLHVLERPATVQDLHLYLSDMSTDQIRASIQELDRRMLVRSDRIAGTITQTFEAAAPLSDFLALDGMLDSDEAKRIRDVDDTYRRAEERHRLDAASDPLRPNIIQGGPVHRASVLSLRNALSKSKNGHVDEALEGLRDAERLDPEFWEIHRVRGFILSGAGRVEEATAAYVRAIELAPSADNAAVVKYYFAGHLTRAARNSQAAEPIAREAHEVLATHKTAFELGRVLTYLGEYAEAESLLTYATSVDDIRTRLIAVTQLVDCMKRRAETEGSAERKPDKAIETLALAIDLGLRPIQEGIVDQRLRTKIVDLASELLKISCMCREAPDFSAPVTAALLAIQMLGPDARTAQGYGYLIGHARRLMSLHTDAIDYAPMLSTLMNESQTISHLVEHESASDPLQVGRIKSWYPLRHFGFITALDGGLDYHFNRAALASVADEIHLASGAAVRYVPVVMDDGRKQAQDIILHDVSDDALATRGVKVQSTFSNRNYLFSIDELSGATVFVGRHALRDGSSWSEISEGTILNVTVEIDSDGRFSAAAHSAYISSASFDR